MGLCESQNNQNQMNKVNQAKINQPKNIEFNQNKQIIKENLKKNNPIDTILKKLLNIDKTKPGCLVKLKEEEIKYVIDNSLKKKRRKSISRIRSPFKNLWRYSWSIYGSFTNF